MEPKKAPIPLEEALMLISLADYRQLLQALEAIEHWSKKHAEQNQCIELELAAEYVRPLLLRLPTEW